MITKRIEIPQDLYYCIVNDLNMMLHTIDPLLIRKFGLKFQKRIEMICIVMNFDKKEVEGMVRFFIKYSDLSDSIVLVDDKND